MEAIGALVALVLEIFLAYVLNMCRVWGLVYFKQFLKKSIDSAVVLNKQSRWITHTEFSLLKNK